MKGIKIRILSYKIIKIPILEKIFPKVLDKCGKIGYNMLVIILNSELNIGFEFRMMRKILFNVTGDCYGKR